MDDITLPLLPQRRAALTCCEHVNGLTSTGAPGLHTGARTHTEHPKTHSKQKQDADNNKAQPVS